MLSHMSVLWSTVVKTSVLTHFSPYSLLSFCGKNVPGIQMEPTQNSYHQWPCS